MLVRASAALIFRQYEIALNNGDVFLLIPEPRLEKSPFGNGFGPHGPAVGGPQPVSAGPTGPLNPFMALNHPAAQAAFFTQTAAAGLSPAHLAAAAAAGLPGAAAAAAAAAAANSISVTGVTSSPAINVGGAPGIPGRPDQFIKGPGMASLEALQR